MNDEEKLLKEVREDLSLFKRDDAAAKLIQLNKLGYDFYFCYEPKQESILYKGLRGKERWAGKGYPQEEDGKISIYPKTDMDRHKLYTLLLAPRFQRHIWMKIEKR